MPTLTYSGPEKSAGILSFALKAKDTEPINLALLKAYFTHNKCYFIYFLYLMQDIYLLINIQQAFSWIYLSKVYIPL